MLFAPRIGVVRRFVKVEYAVVRKLLWRRTQ